MGDLADTGIWIGCSKLFCKTALLVLFQLRWAWTTGTVGSERTGVQGFVSFSPLRSFENGTAIHMYQYFGSEQNTLLRNVLYSVP